MKEKILKELREASKYGKSGLHAFMIGWTSAELLLAPEPSIQRLKDFYSAYEQLDNETNK